jgi:predicted RNA binding protein YcfA (HicA-like mRNA interferase family)
MKIPRDLSATQLAKALAQFGYQVTRQKGSHPRLTTHTNGEHHITLPSHLSLRIGLVSSVLADVASHLGLSRDQLLQQLFE